ncbi:MAG TPA: glutamyl-tRNA reductase [Desulfobacterales bacterium]|nr:glutamyl-tRNA reductase [Desulfobacterales bacterium]
MSIILNIGMNHQTAPVELRECLASDPGTAKKALAAMRDSDEIKEAMFLSTCNRVEALVVADHRDRASEIVIGLMESLGNISTNSFADHLYQYEGLEAVRHVFRVASSLDSMVVGEPQILGQIKAAYLEATKEKTSGVIINRLMHRAFHVAKRVRTETGISEAAVSISYAAVELAKKIFHELDGKKALLIGAGEMAELAARHFMANGIRSMSVANRTVERAVEVARQFGAIAVSLQEIPYQLLEVDIVLSSTASSEIIITRQMVKGCLRKRRNRPLFFIDIAVPRDIDPRVNDLDNVYLFDIDDLKGVTESNLEQRRKEAARAESIIEEEVVKFDRWLQTLAVVPTIISLREKAETIIQNELSRSSGLLASLSPSQKQAVITLSRSIAEKILNDPILFLKDRSDRPTLPTYLDVTRRLFKLDEDGEKE